LLFHALRREELCKIKVRNFRHAWKGVPHLKVSGKGVKTRYLPLHPGTNGLINDYLDAAGHGTDENGALFRPVKNSTTRRLKRRSRRLEELAGLVIVERRRLAFAALHLRPLDALDRIMGDSVLVTEIFEQRGERGQPVPDGAAAKSALRQVVAPGDDVGARDGAKFLRSDDAGEAHEIPHRVFVGAAGARVAEIGEPLSSSGTSASR
jgi:hypothetical protein